MKKKEVSRREFVRETAAAAAGAALGAGVAAGAETTPDVRKTRSYNENMEYRRLGRTNIMISAISLGGHWKKNPYDRGTPEFKKNRREVIYACLDHGMNFVDACSKGEVQVYAEALGNRRKDIYFAFDWTLGRKPEIAGSLTKLKQGLDDGLQQTGLDYADLWRITLREMATRNTWHEIETVMEALEWGKKTGKARFAGVSTHHRPWVAEAVARYPQFDVIITPYAAGSNEKSVGSMFDALRKYDVGFIGIKPFASGSLFHSRGVPDSPTKQADDERARLALRHVLRCDVLSSTIPGLITVDQVRNAAAAVNERRQLDVAEAKHHQEMTREMWAALPPDYEWLRDWEWV